jgi:hypothetical protein
LKEAREYRLKQLKMYDILREVALYSIFVIVTIIVCYDLRDSNAYLLKSSLQSTFIDGGAGAGANAQNSLAKVSLVTVLQSVTSASHLFILYGKRLVSK